MKSPSLSFCGLLCFCLFAADLSAAELNFDRQTIDGNIQIGYGLALGRVDSDDLVDILLADKKEVVWYQNPGEAGPAWKKHVIARNLTARDNVCIAARDIDGDGLVEIAVGANWNPGNTTDAKISGTSFYLQRPQDPTKPWAPVPLEPHEPTTHRMRWLRNDAGEMRLAVLPLHGVGNKANKGENVGISIFRIDDNKPVLERKIDIGMHATHNLGIAQDPAFGDQEFMLVAGAEGYVAAVASGETMPIVENPLSRGAGEVRRYPVAERVFVGIEPMHGTDVVLYAESDGNWSKEVLDTSLSQGHAVGAANLLGDETPEIVAGWRGADANKKFGIKLYSKDGGKWTSQMLDDNGIACEDLKVADLNGDGKIDVIGAGRSTKNVVVYWNRSE